MTAEPTQISAADDTVRAGDDGAERQRAARRRYREQRADSIAESKRRWRQRNADHVKAYRAAYDAAHRDDVLAQKREYMRGYNARQRAEARRRERKRIAAREWYATHREQHLETQRRYRQRKRSEDPDGYRADKRERNRRWLETHREEHNARLRRKYRDAPESKRLAAERYYVAHAEEVKARRRAYYWTHREESLAKQQAWRERERRRRAAGLPPQRLHRLAASDRAAQRLEAAQFFGRQRTPAQIRALRHERAEPDPVSERELRSWARESARQRAAHALATDPSLQRRLQADSARRDAEQTRRQLAEGAAAEAARLDAIARQVNDRLRTQPRQRRPAIDTASPPLGPASTTRGIGL